MDVQGLSEPKRPCLRPHLDRVQVGGHDDLVQGCCQPGGQPGLPLLALWSGVVLQPRPGEEVVDHGDAVVLAWRRWDRFRRQHPHSHRLI